MMADDFPVAALRDAVRTHARRLLLLLVVGALSGALWGALRPRWYAAEVTLVVRRTAALDNDAARPDIADYPTLLANRAVAAQLVKSHDLGRWEIDAPRLLELVQIREVRNTSLLVMVVTLPDPAAAQAVANALASKALELNADLNASDVVRARDMVKSQLDDAVARLGQSEERLLAYRSSALLEMRRADSKAKLDAREELVTLSAELAAERGRLAALDQQSRQTPAQAAGTGNPQAAQELAEQARQFDLTGDWDRPPLKDLGASHVRTREPVTRDVPIWPSATGTGNPVRQLLGYQASASRARVAAMEGRLRDLSAKHRVDSKVLPDLLLLYAAEVRLTRLELEREIAARAVTELSTQYEQARLKVASRFTDLRVVDKATMPTRPVSAGVAVNGMIGLLLGAVAGVLALVPSLLGALVRPGGAPRD